MAVKSIKLRGITRNPSDRMMEEGGVAESLNAFLDNTENRPAAYPKVIHDENKLPVNQDYDVLYLHQGNYICKFHYEDDDTIGTWVNGEWSSMCYINGEDVTNITSVGNTLIINTDKRIHYVLYKEGKYNELGPEIPVPEIKFYGKDVTLLSEVAYENAQTQEGFDPYSTGKKSNNKPVHFESPLDIIFSELCDGIVITASDDNWVTRKEGSISADDSGFMKSYFNGNWVGSNYRPYDRYGEMMVTNIWKGVTRLRDFNHYYGILNSPVFMTFAVRLYDGSVYSPMAPIALGMGSNSIIKHPNGFSTTVRTLYRQQEKVMFASSVSEFDYGYKVHVQTGNLLDQFAEWKDIVEGIDIYITNPVRIEKDYKKCKVTNVNPGSVGGFDLRDISMVLDPETVENHAEDSIVSDMVFHKIISYSYEDFGKYSNNTFPINEDLRLDSLAVKETLDDGYSSNHMIKASDSMVYNGRLSLYNARRVMSKGYDGLNGAFADAVGSIDMGLKFIYEIMSEQGKNLVVYSNEISNQYEDDLKVYPYGFLSYPDARCRSVIVGVSLHGTWTYKRIPMKEMPGADCSYCYAGLNKMIQHHPQASVVNVNDLPMENREEDCKGYVFQSAPNNPFLFPNEGRVKVCDSFIYKVATTTTALSEGQFGNYGLYVFSDEGIWALGINNEGGVISSVPLSRDVAVSKESITPIDQAIVFVTRKGVKILTGSDINDISQFMNGPKWSLDGAKEQEVLEKHGYEELVGALKNKNTFMTFMGSAYCTYDYAGGRLIFLNPDVAPGYLYTYMLASQSWHTISLRNVNDSIYGNPVNSYPECLVSCKKKYLASLTSANTGTEEVDSNAVRRVIESYELHVDIEKFIVGDEELQVDSLNEAQVDQLMEDLKNCDMKTAKIYKYHGGVMDFGTVLTMPSEEEVKGIIVTRGLTLDNDDVLKTIKAVKIRGNYQRYDLDGKPRVQYILQGSQDGVKYFRLGSLKGKAWKMFRIIVMFTLKNTETISWIDVQYDTVFTNKLR